MKRILVISLLLAAVEPVSTVRSQPADLYLSGARPPVHFSASAVYQRYADGSVVSQASIPISLLVPLGRNLAASLHTSPAAAAADDLDRIEGLSDAQVAVSYFAGLGTSSLVASLSANLPSGRRGLTADEFRTSVLLSQNFYDFRVPVLGQGFNFAPGVTWAVPLAENVVAGVGLSYQYRGSYTPIEGGSSYDPGDELLITGGMDVGLSESWILSGDVSFSRYATDELEGVERYQAGNKIASTFQLLGRLDAGTLRLLGRYRTRGKGELPLAGEMITEGERLSPNQGLAHVSMRLPGSARSHVTLLAQARFFSETAAFSSMTLVDLGIRPGYELLDGWEIVGRFAYTFGDFSGFEGGLGVAAQL